MKNRCLLLYTHNFEVTITILLTMTFELIEITQRNSEMASKVFKTLPDEATSLITVRFGCLLHNPPKSYWLEPLFFTAMTV